MENNKKRKKSGGGVVRLCECDDFSRRIGLSAQTAALVTARFPTLKLTRRTECALCVAREYGAKHETVDDAEMLSVLLDPICGGRRGAPTAQELLDAHGDVLSVVAAGVSTGLTQGEAMRLDACVTICLCDGARGLKIKDRDTAALFFGRMYAGTAEAPIAAYLDKDFRIADIRADSDTDVPETAAALGARFVLLAGFDDGVIFDLKSRVSELGKALGKIGVKLIDCIVFTDDGYAALDARSALPDEEPMFVMYCE